MRVGLLLVAGLLAGEGRAHAVECGGLASLLGQRAATMKKVSTWKTNHPYVATACFTLVDLEKNTTQLIEEVARLGSAGSACKLPANASALLKTQLADITKARVDVCGFNGHYQNDLVRTP